MAGQDNSLRNTIVGSVASTLIAAAILYFVPSIWATITAATSWFWAMITYRVALPVWALAILALILMPTAKRIFVAMTTDPGKTWRDYTQDTFHGMVWRWRYSTGSGGCHNVWCFCPTDDTSLVYSTDRSYGEHKIGFSCETCGRNFGPFSGDKPFFIASIERQIDRKIRTEEWKSIVGIDAEDEAA